MLVFVRSVLRVTEGHRLSRHPFWSTVIDIKDWLWRIDRMSWARRFLRAGRLLFASIDSILAAFIRHYYRLESLQKFVIIASARSGSNHTVALLDSHPKITCYSELFNPYLVCYGSKYYDSQKRWWLRNLLPKTFLESVWYDTRYSSPQVGFKLVFDQDQSILKYLVEDPSIKKIVLERKNLLKQYISLQIASRTRAWTSREGSYVCPLLIIDPAAFFHWRRCLERDYRKVRRWLRNQPYLEITYEQITGADRESVLSNLLKFIGVSANLGLTSPLKKQNPDDLKLVVENYHELTQSLEAAKLDYLLK